MKTRWLVAVAMVVGLVAAACGEDEEAGGGAGGDEGPIKIGAIYNVTGALSSIDEPGLNGFKLAAKQINENGGLLGRDVEVVAADGKSDQGTNATEVTRMITEENVVAIGGQNDSTFALAVGPIAQENEIPFVTAGATLPTLPEDIGDYFFMVPFGDDAQAYAIADYATNELGGQSAWMLIDQAYDFTTALAKFFEERWTQNGGDVVLKDSYESGDKDFSSQISRLKALDPQPDMLFVSAIPNEAGITTQQIRQAGLKQPILSGDGFDTPLIAEVAGDLADDVYYSTHASLEQDDPKIQDFVQAYEDEYGKAPENAFAALGYDAMNLIADAIERAESTDSTAIRDALADTEGFEAVTGTVTYPEGERKPVKPITIIEVQNGDYRFVTQVTP